MKLPDKHKRLGLLMIISQLLLIGFTLYWLGGQYVKEKQTLWGGLKAKYNISYRTTVDSFLVKHYIEPVLEDSTINYYRYAKPGRTIMMSDSFMISGKDDSLEGISTGRGVVTINLSTKDDTTGQLTVSEIESYEHEMLLRSLRLIMQNVDDSSRMHLNALHGIERKIDTLLFISTFESQLKEDELKIEPVWVRAGLDSIRVASPGKIVIGGWSNEMPGVKFEGYLMLLLGRIFPQILFAIVLILLTASAFVLAYRSIRKQTQLNAMRDSFIGNISHELKTPVSTVKLAIEAIRNFDLSKDRVLAREYLDMASKEIKRLELLITKVLDNTIIEQDKSILRFEHVNINDIISGAIESLLPKIKDSDAEVRFESEHTISVDADPFYLQGVIINLIDNSLKYGNGHPEIDIALSSSDKNAIIAITDNGPGIPAQYLGKVFDKFFRIPTQDVHNVKGYGLGLSFASLIVEMHGGSISVHNNNTGCTFSVEIPLNKA